MKKIMLCLLANLLIFNACRRDVLDLSDCGDTVDLRLSANDVFIFGSSGGLGGGGLGNYKIKNGQLFRILTNRDSLLSNDLFLEAQSLVTNFPKALKNSPNQNWVGQCRDSFTFFAEIALPNGTKQAWGIDVCGSNAPSYAKCYAGKIQKLSSFLITK